MSKRRRRSRGKRSGEMAALLASLKKRSRSTAREDVRTPMEILAYQLGDAQGAGMGGSRPSSRPVDAVYL